MDAATAVMSGFGNVGSAMSQINTNASNVQMNSANNAFQEQMANTSYQRSVSDMKAAGLNPMMMMAKGGGPEAVPSSSPGKVSPVDYGAAADATIQSALAAMKTDADVQNTNADTLSKYADVTNKNTANASQPALLKNAVAKGINEVSLQQQGIISSTNEAKASQYAPDTAASNSRAAAARASSALTESKQAQLNYETSEPRLRNEAAVQSSPIGKIGAYLNILNPSIHGSAKAGAAVGEMIP